MSKQASKTKTKAKAKTTPRPRPRWADAVEKAIKAANDGAHEIDRATYVAYLMVKAGHLPKTPRKKGAGLDWTATDSNGARWDIVRNGLQVAPAVMGEGCMLAYWLTASGEAPASADEVRAIREVNGLGTQPLYRPVIALLRAQAVKSPTGKAKRAALVGNYAKAMALQGASPEKAAAATCKAAGIEVPPKRKPGTKGKKGTSTTAPPTTDITTRRLLAMLASRSDVGAEADHNPEAAATLSVTLRTSSKVRAILAKAGEEAKAKAKAA